MDGPVPLLENFVFRDISPVDSRGAERIPLPALLFNDQTPRLQRLSIHQTLALSNTVAFRHSLRHLKISAADRAPSLLEMLGTLEQFSLLETLKFSYAPLFEYDASLEVQPVSRRYALPQLLSIQLEAYALECTNILNHLTLP
ncbi:hypothetical protein AcW1_006116 [Taiwanofungus camphoratus]|nr:hypothetical protein AcW1_006116 [Antrodia cinnamomea]